MGTRFGAERAEPEHVPEQRKMPLFRCSRFSGTRQSSVSIWTVIARLPAAQLAPQAVVQPRGRVRGWLKHAIARGEVPTPTAQLMHARAAFRE